MARVSSVVIQRPDEPRLVVVYRKVDGQIRGMLFSCCLNAFGHAPKCSECPACTAKTRSGKRCDQPACIDSELCAKHIRKQFNVVIKDSNIPDAGFGLFAAHPRALRSKNTPTKEKPVFVKGELVAPYGGVRMTQKEFDKLYDFKYRGKKYENTGPYAIRADDGTVVDGLCVRRIGAYANDYHGSNQMTPNARIEQDGLFAVRDIFPDEEVFVDYGADYWEAQSNLLVVQSRIAPDPKVRHIGQKGKVVRR